MRTIVALTALIILVLQTSGCGMLLYPERQGQTGGAIDPGVAVLDAAGLLLFVVPGLVAFGVDFINGTIYLPGTQKTANSDQAIYEIVVDEENLNARQIEEIVASETGYQVSLADQNTEVIAVATPAALLDSLGRVL